MKTTPLRALTALTTGILTACGQSSAPSGSPLTAQPLLTQGLPASGTYKLLNVLSSRALDVAGGSKDDGARIQQYDDNGTPAQQWKLDVQPDGSYRIQNVGSGKVLDVFEAANTNGAALKQWTDYGSPNQRFEVRDLGNSVVSLTAKHSGKVVEVGGFSRDNGGGVQQYDWANVDSQKWRLVKLGGSVTPPPGPTPPGKPTVWWRGVNLAGASWAEDVLPGVYVAEYIYPNQAEVDYFSAKGMNVFRLSIQWERVQRSLFAEFNPDEIARLDQFIAQTTAKGKIVVLDPHNYARYTPAPYPVPNSRRPPGEPKYMPPLIGSPQVPTAAFADLWRRLALRYKGNDKVVFGLMNEPYDISTGQWVDAANAAIRAIRDAGASNLILVPGTRYSGAWTWFSQDSYGESNATAMLRINDPQDNTWFEVHQYMDTYASGTEDSCLSTTIGSERLKAFTRWLRDHGKKGFLGEFLGKPNPTCDAALEDMVKYVEDNGDVWRGWTYWAAGPYWTPGTSLEPNNGVDARQMPILSKFLLR